MGKLTKLATSLAFPLLVSAAAVQMPLSARAAQPNQVSVQEAQEIAAEAYTYAYPLVLMEVTRRVSTNRGTSMNQFSHALVFPDATFTDVVRPNVDTLYSSLWFDVSREPLVISVPDSGGRYYLLQILDMWTDVFASPGKRTTGMAAQTFAIVGPHWQGTLPANITEIRSPTGIGWMIGRTQTNGQADFAAVHQFQKGIMATPLDQFGKSYTPPKGTFDPAIDMTAPVEQMAKMDPATFFTMFMGLIEQNPPHGNDYPILARLKRMGLEPGKPFDFETIAPEVKTALEAAPRAAMAQGVSAHARTSQSANGWIMPPAPIGTYGTAYLARAAVAYFGLGANLPEDTVYPSLLSGPDGKPLDSGAHYVLHFNKDQIPPVRAFWSVTLYDERQFLAANPINRYALGDRDQLHFNPDGSLDLYIQREAPGADKQANWLPTPASGSFTLTMRLYWPTPQVLTGAWAPPAIVQVP